MVSRLCDDGVQGRDGRCVENSSCFQIFLFVPVCILLLGSAAGLICFPLIFTCLPVLFICLPALDCCGRLCLAILCLPALDVAGSSCRVFRFEKHKLFGVYGGVILQEALDDFETFVSQDVLDRHAANRAHAEQTNWANRRRVWMFV